MDVPKKKRRMTKKEKKSMVFVIEDKNGALENSRNSILRKKFKCKVVDRPPKLISQNIARPKVTVLNSIVLVNRKKLIAENMVKLKNKRKRKKPVKNPIVDQPKIYQFSIMEKIHRLKSKI